MIPLKEQIRIALMDVRSELELDFDEGLSLCQILLSEPGLVEFRCAWLDELSYGFARREVSEREQNAADTLGSLGVFETVENFLITIDELVIILGNPLLLRRSHNFWMKDS